MRTKKRKNINRIGREIIIIVNKTVTIAAISSSLLHTITPYYIITSYTPSPLTISSPRTYHRKWIHERQHKLI